MVRSVWGRPEFAMPRPELFAATGEGCPATSLADWYQYHCSTMMVMDGRIRVYNEILIPIVGVVVLLAVWLLLKRSRLGMIIRAGVQDREMVEALGYQCPPCIHPCFCVGSWPGCSGGSLGCTLTRAVKPDGRKFSPQCPYCLGNWRSHQLPWCCTGFSFGGFITAVHHQVWADRHPHSFHGCRL